MTTKRRRLTDPPQQLMSTDWPAGSREAKAKRAWQLRLNGLRLVDIAAAMGLSMSMVSDLIANPHYDGVRARKARYGGTCVDCGGPTDGSGGRAVAPKRCAACATAWQRANAKWTRDTIVQAVRRWASLHGQQPSAADWLRDLSGDYPPSSTVQRVFGSWNAGIAAAGFQPNPVGVRTGQEHWTAQKIVAAIHRWVAEHGDPPTARSWELAGDGRPTFGTVAYVFGTWNAGIRAAGYEPRPATRAVAA